MEDNELKLMDKDREIAKISINKGQTIVIGREDFNVAVAVYNEGKDLEKDLYDAKFVLPATDLTLSRINPPEKLGSIHISYNEKLKQYNIKNHQNATNPIAIVMGESLERPYVEFKLKPGEEKNILPLTEPAFVCTILGKEKGSVYIKIPQYSE